MFVLKTKIILVMPSLHSGPIHHHYRNTLFLSWNNYSKQKQSFQRLMWSKTDLMMAPQCQSTVIMVCRQVSLFIRFIFLSFALINGGYGLTIVKSAKYFSFCSVVFCELILFLKASCVPDFHLTLNIAGSVGHLAFTSC